jgi:hypothetical protein
MTPITGEKYHALVLAQNDVMTRVHDMKLDIDEALMQTRALADKGIVSKKKEKV